VGEVFVQCGLFLSCVLENVMVSSGYAFVTACRVVEVIPNLSSQITY